jgi:hypothetical protein
VVNNAWWSALQGSRLDPGGLRETITLASETAQMALTRCLLCLLIWISEAVLGAGWGGCGIVVRPCRRPSGDLVPGGEPGGHLVSVLGPR